MAQDQPIIKDREACQRFINTGRREFMNDAFWWSRTEQGYSHWVEVYMGHKNFTAQNKQYLQSLLETEDEASG